MSQCLLKCRLLCNDNRAHNFCVGNRSNPRKVSNSDENSFINNRRRNHEQIELSDYDSYGSCRIDQIVGCWLVQKKQTNKQK